MIIVSEPRTEIPLAVLRKKMTVYGTDHLSVVGRRVDMKVKGIAWSISS